MFYCIQYVLMISCFAFGQLSQRCQQWRSVMQIAASQFTQNHRMHHNTATFQQSSKSLAVSTQMIDPHRGVCQYHYVSSPDWRRGIGSNCGSLPPKSAKRRALSRSIKAFKPSRTIALFSLAPLNRLLSHTNHYQSSLWCA